MLEANLCITSLDYCARIYDIVDGYAPSCSGIRSPSTLHLSLLLLLFHSCVKKVSGWRETAIASTGQWSWWDGAFLTSTTIITELLPVSNSSNWCSPHFSVTVCVVYIYLYNVCVQYRCGNLALGIDITLHKDILEIIIIIYIVHTLLPYIVMA